MPNQDWIFEWGPMWPVNAGDNWMSGINSQWNPNYALNTYSEKNRFGYIGWIVLVPRTQASFPFLVALWPTDEQNENIFEWEGPWTFDAYDFYDEEVLATAAIEAIYAEGLSLTFFKIYGIYIDIIYRSP